jgi:rare lipoprotein A
MKWIFVIAVFPSYLQAQQDSISSKETVKPIQFEACMASYYAKKFEGRKCSSGERFRNDSLTAAHKNLPLGTKLKVINLNNDSSVVVRINDRLPKKSKRCIDLTQRAARQLNFIESGVTKVKFEILKDSI